MKLTKLIIAILAVAGISSHAAEYSASEVFVEGTQWKTKFSSYNLADLSIQTWYHYTYIDGEAEMLGDKCLKMWDTEHPDIPDKAKFIAYIKVDGEKVWYIDSDQATEWTLFYDFDIQQGETIHLKEPAAEYGDTSTAGKFDADMTYLGLEQYHTASYGDDPLMCFAYTPGEITSASDIIGSVWRKGLGSACGVLWLGCDIAGLGRGLQKVWNQDKVFYQSADDAGVEGSIAEEVCIKTTGTEILVQGLRSGSSVSVYSADGLPVACVGRSADTATYRASKGIYLVKVDSADYKVMVK